MPPKTTWTKEEMSAKIRELAAKRGGWVSSHDYFRMPFPGPLPALQTLYKALNCEPSWPSLCAVIGVPSRHEDILGDVLTEDDIKLIMKQYTGCKEYSIQHRQQVALYCLAKAHELGAELTECHYNVCARQAGLILSSQICTAFGTWNAAIRAAGFTPLFVTRSNQLDEKKSNAIVADMRSAAVPANWRTHDVYIETLEPVTEVTIFALANGLGLKHTEVRACIR